MSSRLDVEWLAVTAGLKPAMRLSGDANTADEIERRFTSMGAVVVRARGTIGLDRHRADVLYVARRRAEAEALRAAEERILAVDTAVPPKAVELEAVREMGRRLGYPMCCTEAFVARLEAWPVNAPPSHPSEAFLAVRAAWVPRPQALLNNLLLESHARFITFEPCRYDCEVALRFARAVHRAAMQRDPTTAGAMHALLVEPLIVDVRGARALAALDRATRTVVRARPPPRWNADTPAPENAALAARVLNATVDPSGRLHVADDEALLLDFGAS